MPLTPQQLADFQRLRQSYAPVVEAQRRKQKAYENLEKMHGLPPVKPQPKADGGSANLDQFLEGSHTPMRLYHGTTATEGGKRQEAVRRLKPSKEGAFGPGVYMTPDTEYANEYTGAPNKTGGNMLPLHAKTMNPLVVDMVGPGDPNVMALMAMGVSKDKAYDIIEKAYEKQGGPGKHVYSRAKALGHDAMIIKRNGKIQEVVHFNPKMIKSATGNRGTYDTTKDDLSMAKGGLAKFLKDSKVKSRVYHGTESKDDYDDDSNGNDAIKSFAGRATWVAEEPYTAHGYSGKSGYVMPLHIKIKKPLTINHVDANDKADHIYDLAKNLGVDVDHLKSIADPESVWEVINHPYFIDAASKAGFDGLSINEGGRKTHAVFNPGNIKSATGNSGAYDTNNPDITKAKGGVAHMAVGGADWKPHPENDLLQPIGSSKMVGDEKLVADDGAFKAGLSMFPSSKKSYRYVYHGEDQTPIGAMQIATQGPRSKKAVIQNLYVAEANRRQGIASKLLDRARKDFDVKHSDDLTTAGRAFAKAKKAHGGRVTHAHHLEIEERPL